MNPLRLHRPQRARRLPWAIALPLVALSLIAMPTVTLAWGDKGHQVVALIAQANLKPQTAAAIDRLLANDTRAFKMRDGTMTSDSLAKQATWADYYRDSQRGPGIPVSHIHSYHWHFADIEIHGGTLNQACLDFPALPPNVLASEGQDPDCVVNKIEQFMAELALPATPDDEKRLAVKYLLHFVGDLHQPLHASDDADHGGNGKSASVNGAAAMPLHHHWDVTFVDKIAAKPGHLNPSALEVVAALKKPTARQILLWQHNPQPRRWALEAYAMSRHDVYGNLPAPVSMPVSVPGMLAANIDAAPASGMLAAEIDAAIVQGPVYKLSAAYTAQATADVALQLNKAGYRLAALLNAALGD